MNHNTPIYPGAMTQAQFVTRAATIAATIATTAATIAAFVTMFLLFN